MKNIVIILLFFIFCCTGCGYLDDFENDYEEFEGSPYEAYLLSISDNRPAEVTVGWKYYASNGCNGATGVSAERDSNNIYLTIKESIYTGPDDCTTAEEEIYGKFIVKNLEVGEYIIKGNDDNTEEIGRFRIEPDTAYGFIIPDRLGFIIDPIAANNDEQKENTYHVTAVLRLGGWYDETNCESIVKTDIERTQNVINIEAWQIIPKTNCQIILGDFNITAQHERKSIDIDLGAFSTGWYAAIINANAYTFKVPPATD